METTLILFLFLIVTGVCMMALWQDHLEKSALKKKDKINQKARKVWHEMAKRADGRRTAVRNWVRNRREASKNSSSK
jgi:hypothetical protein